ncbi:extracellular solute-binding protein [Paenibacillus roseipurpureus]|uniref:ABC transporter substrate-binding protein n=1 Tax=Paenibacillus roseopurpureus TaxID=2918901 RepID=A0AA96LS09_9BACL|nr:extracellular solute-binding protein [Paenibacillus sp. MBLB1832]WNR46171.1 ABC transporter substrate-binding protein [Paenibacillus sp. MBLB1832]
MKRSKRMFLLPAVALTAISLVASGCSKSTQTEQPIATAANTNVAKATTSPAVDFKGLDFSWYIHYDWAVSTPWGQDPPTQWIKEQKGVNVNFVQSGGAAVQKFNSMIVSNDLPNLITLDRAADLEKLIQAGQLVPLDEYVKKYPNLKKWAGDKTLGMLKSSDGKLYGFPNYYGGENGNTGWALNKEIYTALGSPKLETFAELEDYLRKVKAAYPNVVPLEAGELTGNGMLQAGNLLYAGYGEDKTLIFSDNLKAYPDKNQLQSIFKDPAFVKSVVEANKLFNEKLITQDAFTQKSDQVKEKLKTGRVAVVALNNIFNVQEGHNILAEKNKDLGYVVIPPIHEQGLNAAKIKPANFSTLGWNVSVITKSAKDPEKLFAYMDWATGLEGQQVLTFGPKGLLWDEADADGVPIRNEKAKTIAKADKDKLKIGAGNYFANTNLRQKLINLDEERYGDKKPGQFDGIAANKILKASSYDTTEFEGILPLPSSDLGIIYTQVKDLMKEAYARAVFAKNSDEALQIINKAQSNAEAAGYDKVLKYMTDKWQENLKKMKG